LTELFGESVLGREEEGVATAVGRSASGRLDGVYANESGVIADGDPGWQGGLLTNIFFVATKFRPFGDGIVDLLFV
jgi:hypothetical protein